MTRCVFCLKVHESDWLLCTSCRTLAMNSSLHPQGSILEGEMMTELGCIKDPMWKDLLDKSVKGY